jgi:hypothetical protein
MCIVSPDCPAGMCIVSPDCPPIAPTVAAIDTQVSEARPGAPALEASLRTWANLLPRGWFMTDLGHPPISAELHEMPRPTQRPTISFVCARVVSAQRRPNGLWLIWFPYSNVRSPSRLRRFTQFFY